METVICQDDHFSNWTVTGFLTGKTLYSLKSMENKNTLLQENSGTSSSHPAQRIPCDLG